MIQVFKRHRSTMYYFIFLILITTTIMGVQIVQGNTDLISELALAYACLLLPAFGQWVLKMEFPVLLEVALYTFVFCAKGLGNGFHLYTALPWWDIALHTFAGFVAAAIGYGMVLEFQGEHKNVFGLIVTAFCVSMTVGILWEFFEFSADCLLNTYNQAYEVVDSLNHVAVGGKFVDFTNITEVMINGVKIDAVGYLDTGLIDTMSDLAVNLIGAVVLLLLTMHQGFVKQFIPRKVKN